MRCSLRTVSLIFCFVFGLTIINSQFITAQQTARRASSAKPEKLAANATVTGRVTMNGAPMPGVVVAAYSGDSSPGYANTGAASRARTDADGRYRLSGLSAGRYNVMALAPGLILPDTGFPTFGGKVLTFDANETIENIDFTLERGGVITGRVVDGNGQPVIGESVVVTARLDENGKLLEEERFSFMRQMDAQTDDKGAYRLYGLQPGRYKVSAGRGGEKGIMSVGFGNRIYTKTFYPDVTDIARAEIIEVSAGSEATAIDITLGKLTPTYTATGRVFDAETGEGLAGVSLGQGRLDAKGNVMGTGFSGITSGTRGEFRMEGLEAGRYQIMIGNFGDNSANNKEYYSEQSQFEITDADVSSVEVKMRRGASVGGVVVLEDATNREARSLISQVAFFQRPVMMSGAMLGGGDLARVDASGTFRFTGLRPGAINISLSGSRDKPLPFTIARVERGGVPLAKGEVDVKAGEQINDLRVVLAYGTGRVRGTVTITGGELPANAQINVSLRRNDPNATGGKFSNVDVNRRFLIESVAAGEYEISVSAFVQPTAPNQKPRVIPPVRQTISVSGTGETVVNLTLDVAPREEKQ